MQIDRSMTSEYCNNLIEVGLMRRIGKKGTHKSTYETIKPNFTYEHFKKIYLKNEGSSIDGARRIVIEDYADRHMLQMQANREAQRNRTTANVAIGSSFGLYV